MFNEHSRESNKEIAPNELQQRESIDLQEVKDKLKKLSDDLRDYAIKEFHKSKEGEAKTCEKIAAHISKYLDQGLTPDEKKVLQDAGFTGETIAEFYDPPTPMVGWEFKKDSSVNTIQGWYTYG